MMGSLMQKTRKNVRQYVKVSNKLFFYKQLILKKIIPQFYMSNDRIQLTLLNLLFLQLRSVIRLLIVTMVHIVLFMAQILEHVKNVRSLRINNAKMLDLLMQKTRKNVRQSVKVSNKLFRRKVQIIVKKFCKVRYKDIIILISFFVSDGKDGKNSSGMYNRHHVINFVLKRFLKVLIPTKV